MRKVYTFDHALLGRVYITINPRARRLIGRWRDNHAQFTCPAGVSKQDCLDAIDRMAPRLLNRAPKVAYSDGQVIDIDGIKFVISRQSHIPGKIIVNDNVDSGEVAILVGTELSLDTEATTMTISKAMVKAARNHSQKLLIERGHQLAERVGRHPGAWRVSSGKHILGRCDTNGVISLSCYAVFLPQELRDYIIYHELAHLSEMNHSARFHAICNSYCQGREAEFVARVRRFKWPVVR